MSRLAAVLLLALAAIGCGADGKGFTPFGAPDFTATDLNPDSSTYDETRTLSAERGQVMLLLFMGFACEYCRIQFAELRTLYHGWRAEGIGADGLELWVIGPPIAGHQVGEFADGSDVPCFIDGGTGDESVYSMYGAEIDHLFLIDRQGTARHRLDLFVAPLGLEASRERLDALVRQLLSG